MRGIASFGVDVSINITCRPHQFNVISCGQLQHIVHRADDVAISAAMPRDDTEAAI